MKAEPDYSIAVEIIVLGILLSIGYYFSNSLQKHPLGYIWLALSVATIAIGLWKIENYEVLGSKIKKRNFARLYYKSADLKNLKQKRIKNYTIPANQFLFINLFKNSKKYINFRKIKLTFKNHNKLIIYENTVNSKDFALLLKQLKKYK